MNLKLINRILSFYPWMKSNKSILINPRRLEKVQDLVLYRYGHTGVQECLGRVVELLGLCPVYLVKNVNNFSTYLS